MIRVTREQLIASERGLSVLANAKLPISVSYRINKIIQQVARELQETEKIRQEILQKYAEHNEAGEMVVNKDNNSIQIKPESKEDFAKEITVLFSEICELTGDPIYVNLLDSVTMSSQDIASIEPFLIVE